ncbi:MAG: tetratricopeptide repeat protein [Caldilineaceae bacterium]
MHAIAMQAQKVQDTAVAATCALHLGHLYYLGGDYAAARACLAQAQNGFAHLQDQQGQARALNIRAWIALRTNHLSEAVELATQALSLLAEHDSERANSFYTLGEVAILQQQWPEAERYLRQSLHLWETAGDKRGVARGLRNLGPVLVRLNAFDEAIICYEKAITLFTETEDVPNLAITQMNLGIVYRKSNEPQTALQLYTQAACVFRNVHDQLNLAKVYTNMGRLLRFLGQYDVAEQLQNEAIALWRKLDNRKSLCNALDGLGLIFIEQQCWGKAFDCFQEALGLLEDFQEDSAYVELYQSLMTHFEEAALHFKQS